MSDTSFDHATIQAAAEAGLSAPAPSTDSQKIDAALDRIAALEQAIAPLLTPLITSETGITAAQLATTQTAILAALAEIKVFI